MTVMPTLTDLPADVLVKILESLDPGSLLRLIQSGVRLERFVQFISTDVANDKLHLPMVHLEDSKCKDAPISVVFLTDDTLANERYRLDRSAKIESMIRKISNHHGTFFMVSVTCGIASHHRGRAVWLLNSLISSLQKHLMHYALNISQSHVHPVKIKGIDLGGTSLSLFDIGCVQFVDCTASTGSPLVLSNVKSLELDGCSTSLMLGIISEQPRLGRLKIVTRAFPECVNRDVFFNQTIDAEALEIESPNVHLENTKFKGTTLLLTHPSPLSCILSGFEAPNLKTLSLRSLPGLSWSLKIVNVSVPMLEKVIIGIPENDPEITEGADLDLSFFKSVREIHIQSCFEILHLAPLEQLETLVFYPPRVAHNFTDVEDHCFKLSKHRFNSLCSLKIIMDDITPPLFDAPSLESVTMLFVSENRSRLRHLLDYSVLRHLMDHAQGNYPLLKSFIVIDTKPHEFNPEPLRLYDVYIFQRLHVLRIDAFICQAFFFIRDKVEFPNLEVLSLCLDTSSSETELNVVADELVSLSIIMRGPLKPLVLKDFPRLSTLCICSEEEYPVDATNVPQLKEVVRVKQRKWDHQTRLDLVIP